jgi:aspartate/methionine/tyrosine aminotransferase
MNAEKPRKVAVEMPSYAPVSQFPRALGFEVLPFWRGPKNTEDCGSWRIDRESLQSIIDDVCAVITTPVQNPTGWMMDEDDQQWLSDICNNKGVGLISDEVYLDTTIGTPHYRPMHNYGSHCVSVNSLTKCYGLGPLRIGWIIGSEKNATNAVRVMNNLQGMLATPSLRLAEMAWPYLEEPLELIEKRRAENLPHLIDVLTANGIEWTPPPTGIFGCIPLPADVDCQRFIEDICSKHGVLATPALMFSSKLSNMIRVAWGGEPEAFVAAMDAFDSCLQELK